MPDYLLVIHGGTAPQSPEEAEETMAAWGAWYESIGSAVKDLGNPVGASSTVSAEGVSPGGGANPASGYLILTADMQAAAEDMAKACPVLDMGGSVEVAEIIPME